MPDLRSYLGPHLSAQFASVRDYVTNLWADGDVLHPFYTLHGPCHGASVERIIGDILAPDHTAEQQDRQVLTEIQVFWLLSAAWLHDVGMKIPPTVAEQKLAADRTMPISDYIRDIHHIRSYDYVQSHAKDLGVHGTDAQVIARICHGHRREDLDDENLFPHLGPDVRFLAAVLRIADELDITNARAPQELMALKWDNMDDASRWHWLKHWCVPEAYHHHSIGLDGQPRFIELSYDFVFRIPSPEFVEPFRKMIFAPIDRVLKNEKTNLILGQRNIRVSLERCGVVPLYCKEVFPDGTTLESRLEHLLPIDTISIGEIEPTIKSFSNTLNVPAGALFLEQCRQVALTAKVTRTPIGEFGSVFGTFLTRLQGLTVAEQSQEAVEEMKRSLATCRSNFNDGAYSAAAIERLRLDFLRLGDFAWRITAIRLGDEATKLAHISYVLASAGWKAVAFAEWIATNDPIPSLREESARFLELCATNGIHVNYGIALRLSEDVQPTIRRYACGILGFLDGPDTFARLAEMCKVDVDPLVRESAKSALTRVLKEPERSESTLFGSRVLVVDTDKLTAQPIVDALEAESVAVRVCIEEASAREAFSQWRPHVLILGLNLSYPHSGASGCIFGEEVRAANRNLPIVATSSYAPEELCVWLARISAVYVQKPATTKSYVRIIENFLRQILRENQENQEN